MAKVCGGKRKLKGTGGNTGKVIVGSRGNLLCFFKDLGVAHTYSRMELTFVQMFWKIGSSSLTVR